MVVEAVPIEFGFSQITSIITTVVLVGGLIFGAVRWLETKSEKKAQAAKELADKTSNEIKQIDQKVTDTLNDLRRRADFTNGSVSNIRTDILELHEEIELLSEKDEEDNEVIAKRRLRDKKRREKRRTIEADRIEQSENYLKHGRG